jgi:hypothetical protein
MVYTGPGSTASDYSRLFNKGDIHPFLGSTYGRTASCKATAQNQDIRVNFIFLPICDRIGPIHWTVTNGFSHVGSLLSIYFSL